MISDFLTPKSDTETIIQINRGPNWDGSRWVWSFFMFWWDNSPAVCGKCGRCTNPDNVEPCGHPEAKRYVRGQVFVSNLEETEKRVVEAGRSVRYIRDGVVIGSAEAKATKS